MGEVKQELGPRQLAFVEALESGKYRQGVSRLKREDDCHCVLGVACDLSQLGEWVPDHIGRPVYVVGNHNADISLPESVRKYYRFVDSAGRATDHNSETSLMSLNDTNELPFPEIAKILREHPEQYFTEAA